MRNPDPAAKRPTRHAPPLTWLLAGALVALILAGYLHSGFMLDDFIHLVRARGTSGWASLDFSLRSDALHTRFWWLTGHAVDIRYLRPVWLMLFDLETRWFGLNPVPFHAVSLLLHVGNAVLCYAVGRRMGLERDAAALAALAWSATVHAALAVGWISAQSELLAALFVLVSVLAFLEARRTGAARWWIASASAFALALFTRESAVALPLLILVVSRGVRGERARTPAAYVVTLVALLAVYLAVRRWLGVSVPPPPYRIAVHSIADVLVWAAGILHYIGGAVFGVPVLPLMLGDGADPDRAAIALAVAGGLAAIALVAWMTRRDRVSWPIGWFAAALAPYLAVMTTSLYLYLPLCGVYWLVARAATRGVIAGRVLVSWLLVSGLAGHAVAADLFRGVSDATGAAARTLAGATGAACTDIVLVDAPFWAYALPSAVRLADPASNLRAEFVSFSPHLRASAASVRWTGDDRFEVTSARGFFHSPIERFFLFGTKPCCRDSVYGTGDVTVRCDRGANGGPCDPKRLEVRLRDRTPGCRPDVFRFDGWVPQPVRRVTPSQ